MRGLAQAIVDVSANKTPEQVNDMMVEAVKYLAAHGLLGRWRDLERELHEAWRRTYGASKITVASAHPLTKEFIKQIEAMAQGAEVNQLVDERLLGGALIRVDERRLDGTVLGALTRLKQALLS